MASKILTSSILSIALLFSASVYAESYEKKHEGALGNGKHPYAEKGREILDSVHEDVRMEVVEYQKQKAMLYNNLSDDAKKLVKRLEHLKHKSRHQRMNKYRSDKKPSNKPSSSVDGK